MQQDDGATIECEDGTSARVENGRDGAPGPPGTSGDALDELAHLLGIAPAEVSLPPAAVQPAACSEAWLSLVVEGASLGDVVGIVGQEAVSGTTRYVIALRSMDASVDLPALVSSDARLTLQANSDGGVLEASGIVTNAALAGLVDGDAIYVLVVESVLSRLGLESGYRALFDVDAIEAVQRVLAGAGVAASLQLTGTYAPVPFQMQYDETDLDFLHRLASDSGLHVHVRDDGGVLVADSNAAFGAGPALAYLGHLVPPAPGTAALSSFRAKNGLVPSRASIAGYDPFDPRRAVRGAASGAGLGEIYEFVGSIASDERAERRALVELERAQQGREAYRGTSNAAGVRAGRLVSVSDLGAAFTGTYAVTRVTHVLAPSFADGACFDYGNRFEAIPVSQPFRPAAASPRPSVNGVLPAVVTGVAPSEGRVEIVFPWNRDGDGDSGWVPISFPPGRGAEAFFPEIDDEVLVAFVQGDPSQPVVIGGLWNGSDPPPAP